MENDSSTIAHQPQAAAPCPSCGTCPTCGRKPAAAAPSWPIYPGTNPQPYPVWVYQPPWLQSWETWSTSETATCSVPMQAWN